MLILTWLLSPILLVPRPVLCAPFPVAPLALEQDDSEQEQRASEIRNQSVEDWRAGEFAKAAEKLEQALVIYEELPGEYFDERAVVLRAITWNRMDGGELGAAYDGFERLTQLRKASDLTDSLVKEINTAYDAMSTGAQRESKPQDGINWLAKCAKRLDKLGLDTLRAQVYQDQGSLADLTKQKTSTVQRYFERALGLHERNENSLGAVWARNSLARFLTSRGELAQAGAHLLIAYREVVEGDAADAQVAVAGNVEEWLKRLAESEEVESGLSRLAWEFTEIGDAGPSPRALAPERIAGFAAQIHGRQRGRRRAIEGAQRLLDVHLPGQPDAVAADITLRAAELAVNADPDRVLAWLHAMEIPSGPTAPMLKARKTLWLAVACAGTKDSGGYDQAARDALQLYEDLGSFPAQLGALETLSKAGRELTGSVEYEAIQKEYKQKQRAGRPGGRGGSRDSESVAPGIERLALHDPVFELRFVDGKLLIHDLLGGAQSSTDLGWAPHNHTFNGLALRVWGGYVSVLSMNYGGASNSRGSRGVPSADLLVHFKPLPVGGALVVAKNGAVSYRARQQGASK